MSLFFSLNGNDGVSLIIIRNRLRLLDFVFFEDCDLCGILNFLLLLFLLHPALAAICFMILFFDDVAGGLDGRNFSSFVVFVFWVHLLAIVSEMILLVSGLGLLLFIIFEALSNAW